MGRRQTRLPTWLSRNVRQVCDGGLFGPTTVLDEAGREFTADKLDGISGRDRAASPGPAALPRGFKAALERIKAQARMGRTTTPK
jgi:hypothetical protein